MNRKIPFVKAEMETVDYIPGYFGGPDTPIRNYPIPPRENINAMYHEKSPYWVPLGVDSGMLSVPLYNNLLGRGWGEDIVDAFGVKWVYEPTAGGSIVVAGNPILKDANEWKDKIIFPDVESWDWAKAAEENKIDMKRACQFSFVNGFWFERLISFMDFIPAAMALIDEDQKEAVRSLFAASTDFACRLVDIFCEYWPGIDGFNVHDDWGAQKAPFFSQEVADDLFVPFMRQLTDHIKSKGRYATLHSCGHNFTRIQCFIDGGFQQWGPQTMNDTQALYEQFGDKIIISVVPDKFDPETTSEAEQRERARAHFDRFCKPGKPSTVSMGGMPQAFIDELYEYSRKKYGGFI